MDKADGSTKNSDHPVVTVQEYADLYKMPIDTVRSRIRYGKLQTTRIQRHGRPLTGIILEKFPDEVKPDDLTVNDSFRQFNDSAFSDPRNDSQLTPVLDSQMNSLKQEIDCLRSGNQRLTQEAERYRTDMENQKILIAELRARLEKIKILEQLVQSKDEMITAYKAMLFEKAQTSDSDLHPLFQPFQPFRPPESFETCENAFTEYTA